MQASLIVRSDLTVVARTADKEVPSTEYKDLTEYMGIHTARPPGRVVELMTYRVRFQLEDIHWQLNIRPPAQMRVAGRYLLY